jgi:hypothetical protein
MKRRDFLATLGAAAVAPAVGGNGGETAFGRRWTVCADGSPITAGSITVVSKGVILGLDMDGVEEWLRAQGNKEAIHRLLVNEQDKPA